MTYQTRPKGRQSQEVADATREAMLTGALKAFSESGYEAMSLRNTADQVGVSHGLFRRHFGTKEALWRDAVDHALDAYARELALATRCAGGNPNIRDLVGIMIEVTAAQPMLVRLMVLEGYQNTPRAQYLSDAWHRLGGTYAELYRAEKWEGALKPFVYSDLFLFVLTAGMVPVALPGLSESILGVDIGKPAERAIHIKRIQDVLFPDEAR
ncbi:TetR/AcrR family transcriptional regulator [Cognatiyoonia sp. IB215446]|uniref:TetR/AcrR family transcriptional regulator n=1 Tax=Cognatiyoonia sp. IB215446 TaxID=3097355 RepID=UPI002A0C846E|nr:TetR/AcrR family transcriptional regulator [Cognatiyoonia sp. IB215446]MDX8347191.1 TetR/AcrR family transcriptional regulator [Cognatiyoonia sp. IB215446]